MRKTVLKMTLGAMVVLMGACGTKKIAGGFEEEKNVPAEEYAMEEPAIRAASSFESGREFLAVQGATANARGELSSKLSAAIVAASEVFGVDFSQYAGDDESGMNVRDTETKVSGLVSAVSNNVVKGSNLVKQNKYYNKANKLYKIYVCVEFDGTAEEMTKAALEQIKQKVSDEDRKTIEARQQEFEKKIREKLK